VPLDAFIAADPVGALGAGVAARWGGRLPFLVKILAAARPLSLQAHPTTIQAAAGYAAEEAAGVPLDAPHRVYRDGNPKPELLCALGRFEALAGFRPPAEVADVLEAFGVPTSWTAPLRQGRLAETFHALWDLQAEGRRAMTATVIAGAAAAAARHPREAELVGRLAPDHADDPGVVVALMLNRVRLAPGQALASHPGRLHAYLEGVGLEVMANSDNVVRGGLTTKPVNLPELRRVATVIAEDVVPLEARADGRGEEVFAFDTPEFCVSRVSLDGGAHDVSTSGPEIVVCVDGGADLVGGDGGVALPRGGAAFVPASLAGYRVRGVGTLYRTTVGATGRD
jgi:mannose-6-phosphate isomerase